MPSLLTAQKEIVNLRHFSVEDGLSSRMVYDTYQDSLGLMWISTNYGINRYDGYQFIGYGKEHSNIPNNFVQNIIQDKQQRFWLYDIVQYERGGHISKHAWRINIFDPIQEKAVPFEALFDAPFSINDMTWIAQDNKKNIYISTQYGAIFRYDGHSFQLVFKDPKKDHIQNFAIYNKNKMAIYQPDQLLLANESGKLIDSISLVKNHHLFFTGRDGRLWREEKHIPTASLFFLNDDLEFVPFPKDGLPIDINDLNYYSFHEDHRGRIWTQRLDSWHIFDKFGNSLDTFSNQLNQFPVNPLNITFDIDNNAWVSTRNGVYLISTQANPFQTVLEFENLTDVRGITQDQAGNTYIAAQDLYKTSSPFFKISIEASLATICDQAGNIWLGSYDSKFARYTPSTGETFVYKHTFQIGENRFTTPLLFQQKQGGKIWIGTTFRGLAYVENEEIVWFNQYNEFEELKNLSIQTFHETDKGIWLGTNKGLYFLDPSQGIVAAYHSENSILPVFDPLHIYEDQEGIIWIATRGNGLIRWDKPNNKIQQFREKDGLSNDVIYAVYEDDFKQLWLPSNKGLMCFDKTSFQVQTYLPKDGLLHQEFNTYSHYQAEDGQLFFGGLKGVISFYPKDLNQQKKYSTNSNLVVTAVEQFDGQSGEQQDISRDFFKQQKIILSPNIKSFLVRFSMLDYADTSPKSYAFRIKGWQNTWSNISENFIRINSLPYGNFVLEVKAKNSKGQAANAILEVPIFIKKPFYLKNWFWGCALLLFLLGLYLLYQWRTLVYKERQKELEQLVAERTEKIQQQTEELKKIDELKSRFFANVSHELRTPLTMIIGPAKNILERSQIPNRDFTLVKLIQQNAQQLLKLVNEILDLNKLEAGKLRLEESKEAFYPLLQRILSSFESHAQINQMEFHFQYQADTYLNLYLDKNKFEIILNNLLSNALKFTPSGGKIEVITQDLAHSIQIMVKDNGKGIHAADLPQIFDRFYQSKQVDQKVKGGTGIGLALSQEYVQLMNGSLDVESEWGKGATFVFQFPKKEVLESIMEQETEQNLAKSDINKNTLIPVQPLATNNLSAKQEKVTILIVEDNLSLQEYLQLILSDVFDVKTARNGQQAIDILQQNGQNNPTDALPSLIISDVMMPMMDGFELLQQLKASEKWQGIPVIMLTARTQIKDKLKALRIGVDDYIHKPFEEEELLARIQNLLKHAYARQLPPKAPISAKTSLIKKAIDHNQAISPTDLEWLKEVEEKVVQEIGSFTFSVEELSHQLALSTRQLQRKLKSNAGLTPQQYIQEVRLNKAREWLEIGQYSSVKSVAYAVAMKDAKHFSKLFKKRFGKSPSAYLS